MLTPVAIALGSNVPLPDGTTPPAIIGRAADCIRSVVSDIRCSPVVTTQPVGITHQPTFSNAVLVGRTEFTPQALLSELLHIERMFGRNREQEQRWGPRTLDLDILFYGQLALSEPQLTLPHPRFAERPFLHDLLTMVCNGAACQQLFGVTFADDGTVTYRCRTG